MCVSTSILYICIQIEEVILCRNWLSSVDLRRRCSIIHSVHAEIMICSSIIMKYHIIARSDLFTSLLLTSAIGAPLSSANTIFLSDRVLWQEWFITRYNLWYRSKVDRHWCSLTLKVHYHHLVYCTNYHQLSRSSSVHLLQVLEMLLHPLIEIKVV